MIVNTETAILAGSVTGSRSRSLRLELWPMLIWRQVGPRAWTLADDNTGGWRHIGEVGLQFRVTATGHEPTEHPSLEDAKAAAAASLRATTEGG